MKVQSPVTTYWPIFSPHSCHFSANQRSNNAISIWDPEQSSLPCCSCLPSVSTNASENFLDLWLVCHYKNLMKLLAVECRICDKPDLYSLGHGHSYWLLNKLIPFELRAVFLHQQPWCEQHSLYHVPTATVFWRPCMKPNNNRWTLWNDKPRHIFLPLSLVRYLVTGVQQPLDLRTGYDAAQEVLAQRIKHSVCKHNHQSLQSPHTCQVWCPACNSSAWKVETASLEQAGDSCSAGHVTHNTGFPIGLCTPCLVMSLCALLLVLLP